jgi:hypothetical protein
LTTIARHITTPRQASETVNFLWRDVIKPHTVAHGEGVLIWQTASTYRRHQLRKMLHGPVLGAIAEQIWLTDPATGQRVRYSKRVWKQYLAEQFLPPRFEEYATRAGELRMRKLRDSTEAASDDELQLFVTEVMAWAAVEYGVEFPDEEEAA